MDPEPGELIFFHGHPAWRSMVALYAKGLVLAVLAGVIAGVATRIAHGSVEVGWVAVAVLACLVVVGVIGLIRRLRKTYTITEQRLTIDIGLLARDVHETRLERVQNVNSSQSLVERVLRIGTVDFDTAGGAEFNFAFHGVADPHRIVRTVDRALKQLQQRQSEGV
jgi:uncharacterized membrane protein YdbT with pleckstrin-like domain